MKSAQNHRTSAFGPNFTNSVMPSRAAAGSLLGEYSVRLGDAIFRHRAEIAERATRVQAEISSKTKSEFIANISHELRTPLNAILGFSKIMSGDSAAKLEETQVTEYAGVIHESAEGLLLVLNDVITVSKLQSDRLEVDLYKVDVEDIFDVMERWVKQEIAGTEKRFIMRAEPDLPMVDADNRYLQEVLKKLLSNAIKFTADDGTVALFARRLARGGVMLSVSDTGIGMTTAEVAVALEPFGQVDNRLDRSHGGTGLGLTIARGLVELQGGELQVASEEGVGTDVVLIFPETADQD